MLGDKFNMAEMTGQLTSGVLTFDKARVNQI